MKITLRVLLLFLFASHQTAYAAPAMDDREFSETTDVFKTEFKAHNISGTSGKPLALKIKIRTKKPTSKTMVLLRGIPRELSLSIGILRNQVWAIPYKDIHKTKLISPKKYHSDFTVEAFFFKDEKRGPLHDSFKVSIIGNEKGLSLSKQKQNSPCGSTKCPATDQAEIFRFAISNAKGKAGQLVPLKIIIEGENLKFDTMLLFRKIPPQILFNLGIFRDGVWSVSYADYKKIRMIIPPDYRGSFNAEAFLFKDKESAPEHRRFSVVIQ